MNRRRAADDRHLRAEGPERGASAAEPGVGAEFLCGGAAAANRQGAAWRSAFEQHGYVVLKGLLDSARDLAPLLDDYGVLLQECATRWHREGRLSSSFDHLPLGDRFAAVLCELGASLLQYFDISLPRFAITADTPIHLGASVFGLMRNDHLLDAVESLIGPEIFCNPVQRFRIRPPEGLFAKNEFNALAMATPWHQDLSVYLPEADDSRIVSVWIPLTSVALQSGCLRLVPGSHKSGLLRHVTTSADGTIRMGAHIPAGLIESSQAVAVAMAPGDVLFFDKKTVHASLPNHGGETRLSIDFRYNPIGEPTGRPAFPGFVARSRRDPRQELRDPGAWAQSWRDCRSRMAATGGTLLPRPW